MIYPLFDKARPIIIEQDENSIEKLVTLIDKLEYVENEARKLRYLLFESTYNNVVSSFLSPIDELLESEY